MEKVSTLNSFKMETGFTGYGCFLCHTHYLFHYKKLKFGSAKLLRHN